MTKNSAPSLVALLIGCFCLWAVAGVAIHGPVILAYIAIQLATSGIFALEMRRIVNRLPKHDSHNSSKAAASSKQAA